jgi:hypothetical protein
MCETWGDFGASVKGGASLHSLIPEARQLLGGCSGPTPATTEDEPEIFEMFWAQEQVSAGPADAPPFIFSPSDFHPSDLLAMQFIPFDL